MIGELVEHACQPNSGLNAVAERALVKLRAELEASRQAAPSSAS